MLPPPAMSGGDPETDNKPFRHESPFFGRYLFPMLCRSSSAPRPSLTDLEPIPHLPWLPSFEYALVKTQPELA